MRRWIAALAAVGFAQGAGAGEFNSEYLRGSDVAPTYQVTTGVEHPVAVVPPPPAPFNFTVEVGTRYWYSSGKLAKDLFDDPRSSNSVNSRLTYDRLTSNTFEAFGRFDTWYDTFVKGYVGVSRLGSGRLNDEDFPPALTPYSSTLSEQRNGRLDYASIDLGRTVVTRGPVSAAVFVGYGYLSETTNAYGCNQVAGNPFVCVPGIASNVLGITEEARWQFLRLGVLAEFRLHERLKLSTEVALLPYAQISAKDTHWLQLGTTLGSIAGPIPEEGNGMGVQFEALLSYQVADRFSLGIGGRYWYLETWGSTDFESMIVGFHNPVSQPLNFTTARYGVFVQADYKFGSM